MIFYEQSQMYQYFQFQLTPTFDNVATELKANLVASRNTSEEHGVKIKMLYF